MTCESCKLKRVDMYTNEYLAGACMCDDLQYCECGEPVKSQGEFCSEECARLVK